MIDRDDVIDVLTKCTGYDPRAPQPSEVVLAAWVEHFAGTNLDRDELLAAVAEHYAIPGVGPAMPADLSAIVYAHRKAALEAAERYAPPVFEPPPTPGAGRIEAFKALDDAMAARSKPPLDPLPRTVSCDWCHAGEGQPCTVPGTAVVLMRPPYYHPSRIDKAHAKRAAQIGADA